MIEKLRPLPIHLRALNEVVQDGGSVSFTYAWGGESCLKASVQREMFAKETGETRDTDETEETDETDETEKKTDETEEKEITEEPEKTFCAGTNGET